MAGKAGAARAIGAARETRATRAARAASALGGNEEFATATIGYPDGVTVEAEGAAFHAGSTRELAQEANIAHEAVYETTLGAAVIAGAGNNLFLTAAGASGASGAVWASGSAGSAVIPISAGSTRAASPIVFASPGPTIIVAETVTRAEATWAEIERILRLRLCAEAEQ